MAQTLFSQKNYLTNIPYIINMNMAEYDIKKANINILSNKGAISQEYYNKLYNMSRMDRQVEIGFLLLHHPEYNKILSDGIIEFKEKFFLANDIQDANVLSIKNDAVFLINKPIRQSVFDNIEFVRKNTYSTYMSLIKGLEFYFKSDMVNNTIVFDIKGISDTKLLYHENYLISWIANIIYLIETGYLEDALSDMQSFYQDYITFKLPVDYYRTFDSNSMYIVNARGIRYTVPDCEESNKIYLDINTNLRLILELYKLVSSMLINKR